MDIKWTILANEFQIRTVVSEEKKFEAFPFDFIEPHIISQIWKGTIKGRFQWSLVKIDLFVLEMSILCNSWRTPDTRWSLSYLSYRWETYSSDIWLFITSKTIFKITSKGHNWPARGSHNRLTYIRKKKVFFWNI